MTNKKILVVEDDAEVRRGYHILLKANHYESYFAADGVHALIEARKQQPDLIILDLGLPAGDGFTVLERLRGNTYLSVVPVVVVSGRDLDSSMKRALAAGASAYLQKPWNDNELLAIISRLLGEPELDAQQAS